MTSASTIRDLLSRAKVSPEESALKLIKAELDTLFSALSQPGVNEDFRSDLIKVVTSAIDAASTLASASYNIDEVLTDLGNLSQRISFILGHVAAARPRTMGFGLVHRDNGRVLPNIWLDESEATKYVNSMRDMGVLPPSVVIIPIELASRYIPRPKEPPVQALTAAPDPIPEFLSKPSTTDNPPATSDQNPSTSPPPIPVIPKETK